MSGQASIKRNIGFQTAYQVLNTCLPLITAPYLARVLGAEQLGVFTFTSSIVAYFTLIAMLGTVNYGTRSIASVKEDQDKLNKTFWSVYSLQAVVSLAVLVVYIGYLLLICRENKMIAAIQIVAVVDCIFNINWLFFGLERFQLTVTRSFFVRIFTAIAILVFVNKPGDLWVYTLIMLGGTVISNLVMWFCLPKTVGFYKVSYKDILPHIKPNLILFVPLLATSVYHTMDKTMLGLLSTYEQTGYYYNADKVINIPVGILTGVPTVLLPRMTALITAGRKKEGDGLFVLSLEGVTMLSVAISFGVAAIAKEFTPVFFGEGYDDCAFLIMLLAPVLVIKGLSITARNQYLIPYKLEKVFIQSVFIGALINLLMNWALIPAYGAMGAVIGTLTAELAACVIQYWVMRKYISLGAHYKRTAVYIIFGLFMLLMVRLIARFSLGVYLKLILEVFIGAAFYFVACFIYWRITKNKMYKEVFGGLLNKLHIHIPD